MSTFEGKAFGYSKEKVTYIDNEQREENLKKTDILQDVGMSEKDLELFRSAVFGLNSLVLVTGPLGSGKSTTIYKTIEALNDNGAYIVTAEDPIEKAIPGVRQIAVNVNGNTHADAIKRSLRMDPEAVYISELKDAEVVDVAFTASFTGHLVLSSLHASSAAESLTRLAEYVTRKNRVTLGEISLMIVSQKLVRKICDECKELIDVNENILADFDFRSLNNGKQPTQLYAAVGCYKCDSTGYDGKIPVFEVMRITESIIDMATKKVDLPLIEQEAKKNGFTTMKEDGFCRVLEGVTTIDEVLKATDW